MAAMERPPKPETGDGSVVAARSKRVRTGCLTCRERHLKCDEGVPDCVNCRKSNRPCRRGVRLNFIDTQVKTPPITPPTHEWDVTFQDESREIASEYKGGLGRYAVLKPEPRENGGTTEEAPFEFTSGVVGTPSLAHQQLPAAHAIPHGGVSSYAGSTQRMTDPNPDPQHQRPSSASDSTFSSYTLQTHSHTSFEPPEPSMTPPSHPRAPLSSPEELLFMQVFVEEVGLWMDSMDPYKHVRRSEGMTFPSDRLSSLDSCPLIP
jgi:hypothetical protein